MALFPRARERRQREQQARGATPALQPSVARRGMFRGRPREINLTVARADGGELRRNIDTGAQRVVYPEQPIPSPSDAVVPEKGNFLRGMANLSVNPRTGLSRMRYVDGVEMTPARRMFQRGMNETLKQQQGDPELAQGYFTRAYRLGQAQGLQGPEMDMIQQKSMDTRMNNMSLRAGTQVPYYANERDPETGAYIPPEDRVARAYEDSQRRVGDQPVGRTTRFPADEIPQMGGAAPSPSPSLGSAAPSQDSAIQSFAIPGVGNFDFTKVAPPNASEFTELVPGQPPQGLLAPPQPSAQDRLSSQLRGELSAGSQSPPSPPPSPARQRSSMEDQLRSQARAENQSAAEKAPPAYSPTFSDSDNRRQQTANPVNERSGRLAAQGVLMRERMLNRGMYDNTRPNTLGVEAQPAPLSAPRDSSYQTYTAADTGVSRQAKVVGMRGGNAIMQFDDGSQSSVPLSRLDQRSRDLAVRNATFAPPENVPIDEAYVAQAGRNARNRLARATQPGGLPDIPDPNPYEPLLAPRGSAYYNPDDPRNRKPFVPLADREAGQVIQDPTSGINTFASSSRRTMQNADGSYSSVGMGQNVRQDDNGNLLEMTVDPQTGEQKVAEDQYGRPLAIDPNQPGRRFALNEDGTPADGGMTTAPTTARGRREAIIEQANSPDATPEQLAAAAKAREELDKYNEYMDRRDKRKQDAIDLKSAASQLRSYGRTGQLNMGYNALGNTRFQPMYGQTGPSFGQAVGQVKRERDAQKRLDDEMKRQQEMEDREMKVREDEAATRKANAELQARQAQMDMEAKQGELDLMKREQRIAKSPAGNTLMFPGYDPAQRYAGIVSIMNGVDDNGDPITDKEQSWYLQNQFGINTKQQLIDAADAAGYSKPGEMTWSDFFTFDWIQWDETDQNFEDNIHKNIQKLPGTNPLDKPKSSGVGSKASSRNSRTNSRNSQGR